jgi:hypothetical protein
MRNDSADGRTVGAHSEAFSGGAYSRWACWTQADPDSSCAGSGTVDSQHRCAMAHAAAKLSELQNCTSTLSNLVLQRDFASGFDGRCQRASRQSALDEEECFIDATFVMAKGGGSEIGPTKRGKGMKIMAIVDRMGCRSRSARTRRTITKSAWCSYASTST